MEYHRHLIIYIDNFFPSHFRQNGGNSHCRLSLFALLAVFVCLLTSCGHTRSNRDLDVMRHAADSVVGLVEGEKSLDSIIQKSIKKGDKMLEMRARKELGRTYRESNLFGKAIECHRHELALAKQLHDTIAMVQTLNNIGTNYRRMGVLDEAINYHYRALHLAEAFSLQQDPTAFKNRLVSLNGIGNICLTLSDTETADSVFRAALAGERFLGSHLGQAINYANIGSLFEHSNRTDSAWTYYRLSMEQNKLAHSDLGISLCHTHFGRLYEKEGKIAQAIAEYHKAYDIMASSDDQWHAMEPCLALAQIYVKEGNHSQAKHYLAIADNVAHRLKSLEHQSQVAWLYYNIYHKEGDNRNALKFYKQYNELGDSVASEKNLIHMQKIRIRYEHEQRRAEVDAINKEYRTERTLKMVSIATVFLVIILAAVIISFLVYALNNRKRKQLAQQQMNEMRVSFFTNITHEFRTPLTVILGYAQMMEKGKLPPEDIANIGHMVSRQGSRLLSLINQLLDIQKVKSTIGQPEWRRGDIVLFISTIVESYLNLAHSRRISLMYAPKQQKAVCDFVPDYAQKVVCNLVTNAIKFSEDGGRVLVAIDIKDDILTLRVADYGTGISEADRKRIFEPFYQTDTKKKSIGSGVGLALVKQIVSSLKGSIDVSSRIGVGSVFVVKVPVKAPVGAEVKPIEVYGTMLQQLSIDAERIESAMSKHSDDKAEKQKKDKETVAKNDTRPLVLIVEDNADVAEYMSMQLRKRYQLAIAKDGEEGLRLATETVPDLIITDLMMPRMDGYALCQAVKQAETLNHIPVIIVTAKATQEDKLCGLQMGVDAYLYKPFNAEELTLRVENLLERTRQLREKYKQAISDNVADASAALAPRDRAFIQHLDEVIYENMGGGDVSVDSVSVSMHMTTQQLRRKLLAVLGEAPNSYIRSLQIKRTHELLGTQTDLSISQIARLCGFYDMSHFSKIFKQCTGVSPSQYRKKE